MMSPLSSLPLSPQPDTSSQTSNHAPSPYPASYSPTPLSYPYSSYLIQSYPPLYLPSLQVLRLNPLLLILPSTVLPTPTLIILPLQSCCLILSAYPASYSPTHPHRYLFYLLQSYQPTSLLILSLVLPSFLPILHPTDLLLIFDSFWSLFCNLYPSQLLLILSLVPTSFLPIQHPVDPDSNPSGQYSASHTHSTPLLILLLDSYLSFCLSCILQTSYPHSFLLAIILHPTLLIHPLILPLESYHPFFLLILHPIYLLPRFES